jgi:hypothetical protein
MVSLSPEDKRISIDRGDITSAYSKGTTGVCSIYTQAMCVKNLPVVPRDPKIVTDHPLCGLLPYLSSRLVHFNMWMSTMGGPCSEYQRTCANVEDALEIMWDDDYLMNVDAYSVVRTELPPNPVGSVADSNRPSLSGSLNYKNHSKQPFDKNSVISENFAFMNVPLRGDSASCVDRGGDGLDSDIPTFLLSGSDIKKRPVHLDKEPFSIHIQDHGAGPMVLYTFRSCRSDLVDGMAKSDKEAREYSIKRHSKQAESTKQSPYAHAYAERLDKSPYSFEQLTRTGVLGRISIGVFRKLLEVSAHNGTASLCGHLLDSSFSLAHLLLTLVHDTSLHNVITRLEFWRCELTESIEEIAVTKHARHIDLLQALYTEVQAYVTGFNEELESLVNEFYRQGGTLTTSFESSLCTLYKRPPHEGCIELQESFLDLQAKTRAKSNSDRSDGSSDDTQLHQQMLTHMHVVYMQDIVSRLQATYVDDDAVAAQKQLRSIKAFVPLDDYKNLQRQLGALQREFNNKYANSEFSDESASSKHSEEADSPDNAATANGVDDTNANDNSRVTIHNITRAVDSQETGTFKNPRKLNVLTSNLADEGKSDDDVPVSLHLHNSMRMAHPVAPKSPKINSASLSLLSRLAANISTRGDMLQQYCSELSSDYSLHEDAGHHTGVMFEYSLLDESARYDKFKEFTTKDSVASKAFNISIDMLPFLTRGYPKNDPLSDMEGTLYWQHQIEHVMVELTALQDRYQRYLDEKRNFWSFLLGIVSIATFPFAVMTGYFGMNFENMAGEKFDCAP